MVPANWRPRVRYRFESRPRLNSKASLSLTRSRPSRQLRRTAGRSQRGDRTQLRSGGFLTLGYRAAFPNTSSHETNTWRGNKRPRRTVFSNSDPYRNLPHSKFILPVDQQLRCEALFLEQLARQPECRLRIAPTLDEHVEDLALVVDGAPQVHPFPGDPNDHFVEVPSRAWAWAALPQLARDQRAEFQHPAPHRLI
jgi:hypothetical protein